MLDGWSLMMAGDLTKAVIYSPLCSLFPLFILYLQKYEIRGVLVLI